MPIYEYACPKCGTFDVLQKMSAPTLEVHEACGSPVTKLMSAGAFSVKGSGAGAAPACERRSATAPACQGCPSAQA
jgi:putative FmdB family regulatory protein